MYLHVHFEPKSGAADSYSTDSYVAVSCYRMNCEHVVDWYPMRLEQCIVNSSAFVDKVEIGSSMTMLPVRIEDDRGVSASYFVDQHEVDIGSCSPIAMVPVRLVQESSVSPSHFVDYHEVQLPLPHYLPTKSFLNLN